MKQEITMLGMEHSIHFVPIPDAYMVRKDGRLVWLQRVCAWLLSKLGKHAIEREVTLERHVIDSDDFMQRVFQQCDDIVRLFNREPKNLLVGTEDFAEIMGAAQASQPFTFQSEYWHRGKIFGLTVQVVPWMKGILVMPNGDES